MDKKEYQISEKDIESALRYLQTHDPKNATREQAEALLKDLQSGFHSMAHDNPELLLQLQKELEQHKKSQ